MLLLFSFTCKIGNEQCAIYFIFYTFLLDCGPFGGYKMTPKWSWPGSCDLISKFWDPLNNFWMNWAIHFKFGTEMEDGPLLCVDHKTTPKWVWPGSHDPILKFWDTPYNFWTNRAICFKFGIDIEDGHLLHVDHKKTHKWAWPGSLDPISKFWDPIITFEQSYPLQIWYWHRGLTPPTCGP